jgi:chromosomal replication initiation ATPase DnaA
MSRAREQFVFDWGARPALGAEDFLVGPSNAAAVALVDRWPDWSMSSALVVGPAQSGKSHLAHVWQLRSEAVMLMATKLGEERVPELIGLPAVVVEDIDRGIASEKALFHLLNLAREQRTSLLLTSRAPAGELAVALPDLRSRLRALAMTEIGTPDQTLLTAVLVKLLADRQIAAAPAVVHFLARELERSFAAAAGLVEALDRLSLAQRRPVTRALAAEALGALRAAEKAEKGD